MGWSSNILDMNFRPGGVRVCCLFCLQQSKLIINLQLPLLSRFEFNGDGITLGIWVVEANLHVYLLQTKIIFYPLIAFLRLKIAIITFVLGFDSTLGLV